jgi:(p)ppGpp synthase/HD superfamily hydrolase
MTHKFANALTYAAKLHAGDLRKGNDIPYVAHLLAVAALVLEAGGTETHAIAALLHDAVEDHPRGGRTAREIKQRFGADVLRTTLACSDKAGNTTERTSSNWRQRKQSYIDHLEELGPDAGLVSLADKVHNVGAINADYLAHGDCIWSRFNAGKRQQLWYYRELASGFRRLTRRTDARGSGIRLMSRTFDSTVRSLTSLVNRAKSSKRGSRQRPRRW